MTLRNLLLGATMLCAATTPVFAFAQEATPAGEQKFESAEEVEMAAGDDPSTPESSPA